MNGKHNTGSDWRDAADKAFDLWSKGSSVLVLTGAGISVASGIPDFRSPGGLWSRYDPMEVATLQALRTNPKRVWEFLIEAVDMLERSGPNPAHLALARIEELGRISGIVTQNIDGLHTKAGSTRVVEFHGGCGRFYCMRCKEDCTQEKALELAGRSLPPLCSCGGVIRPDFVFFNEQIPPRAMQEALMLTEQADLSVIIGTSGEIAPANTIPHRVKARGGQVIEINMGASSYGDLADVRVFGPAEEVLPLLADGLAAGN